MPPEIIEEEVIQAEQVEEEVTEATDEVEETPSGEAEEVEEELVVTIGDQKPEEEEQQAAPEWVRELRKNHRELQKKNRELEEQLKAKEQKSEAVRVGEKPTLESCEYDEGRFETELTSWYDRKRQADEAARKIEEEKLKQQETWNQKLASYATAKTELKVKDFEEAEATVQGILDVTQQGIIMHGAKNPALVVYALGKNEAKAKELAAIKDPVQFAVAVGELGKEINMKPRNKPPAPEQKIVGSGSLAGAVDGTLERLRSEAEKTGDYSKVMQYKNQLRNKK